MEYLHWSCFGGCSCPWVREGENFYNFMVSCYLLWKSCHDRSWMQSSKSCPERSLMQSGDFCSECCLMQSSKAGFDSNRASPVLNDHWDKLAVVFLSGLGCNLVSSILNRSWFNVASSVLRELFCNGSSPVLSGLRCSLASPVLSWFRCNVASPFIFRQTIYADVLCTRIAYKSLLYWWRWWWWKVVAEEEKNEEEKWTRCSRIPGAWPLYLLLFSSLSYRSSYLHFCFVIDFLVVWIQNE